MIKLFNQQITNITYNGQKYSIIHVYYKKDIVPVVVNRCNINLIKNQLIKLECDDLCNISCVFAKPTQITKNLKELLNPQYKLNQINYVTDLHLDNRNCNLKITKTKLKTLPNNILKLPEYIWYVKEDKTHGDRFYVKISNYKWTTTSSKKYTMRQKLDSAIQHMLEIRNINPEIFKMTNINDEMIMEKKKILDDFYNIIYQAGFKNIKQFTLDLNGNIIKNNIIKNKEKKQKQKQNFDLPKYVFYRSAYKNRGSFFAIENHPKINKIWRTTTSKFVDEITKYNEMMNYYKLIN